MNEFLGVVVPPSIAGLFTVVVTWMQRPREDRSGVRTWTGAVVVVGPMVTLLLAVVLLAWLQVQGVVEMQRLWASGNRTLDDFPQSEARILADQQEISLDAEAVLLGAGPKQWDHPVGPALELNEVFYVDQWEWVDVVYSHGGRTDPNETCGIEPLGEITVRGFSDERGAALVEYTAPGASVGTSCGSETFVFYPLPSSR